MGDRRSAYRVLVGRPDGKRLLGRPWHSCRIILKRIFKKWDVLYPTYCYCDLWNLSKISYHIREGIH